MATHLITEPLQGTEDLRIRESTDGEKVTLVYLRKGPGGIFYVDTSPIRSLSGKQLQYIANAMYAHNGQVTW